MNGKIAISVMIFVGAFVLIGLTSYFSYSNEEIQLRNLVDAQQQTNEAYFDKMWKIISQKAEVSQQYENAFREIYPDLMKGRYDNNKGGLMSWIQEHNPNFDTSLFASVMTSIEAERTGFFVEQKKLIDLGREHNNLIEVFPSSVFLMNRDVIDLTIIKSEQTEDVFKVGKEELNPLFNK